MKSNPKHWRRIHRVVDNSIKKADNTLKQNLGGK